MYSGISRDFNKRNGYLTYRVGNNFTFTQVAYQFSIIVFLSKDFNSFIYKYSSYIVVPVLNM